MNTEYLFVKEVMGPLCIIFGSIFLYLMLTKVVKHLFGISKNKLDARKRITLIGLTNNIMKYIIIIVALLMILDIYGVDTKAIIASLGVVGVVIGLALQDTLKDFLAGVFILTDDQYHIGDTITVNTFKGEVISLGLKTTKIRAYTGEIKIVSNRNITEVTNHSIGFALAEISVQIGYDADLERVLNILEVLMCELSTQIKGVRGKIEIWGVNDLSENGPSITIAATTKPMEQYRVAREMRKAIKLRFDKFKIDIPCQQVVIQNGTGRKKV